MTRGVFRRTAAFAAAALLASCAVGPDFAPPSAPAVSGYTPERLAPTTASAETAGGEAQHFVKDLDLPGQWWTLFHSKPLNALVEKALASNQDLRAAQAALRVARENVRAQQGNLLPSIDANASAFRGLPPIGGPLDNSVQAPTFNLFTTQLSISYAPDVFGGVRRSIEVLVAQKDQQRFQLEATYLTLTSNLAGAAVLEASLRGQISATEEIIKAERDVLDLLRKQRAAGQIAEADVVAQEAALAQVEQTLPPLQKQLAQVRDLLAALAGGFPSERLPMRFELSGMRLPRKLPVSIPAKLIEQRPDVRMAEEALHAASAQIGVTIAARLPGITLTGNAGSTSDAIKTMFGSGTEFWTITGSVAQPIFHGGTLFHQELAAKAAFDEAQAQYRSTVITAFQNVADSLRAIQSDAIALQKAVASERAASHSLEIVRGRLKLGDVNYLALLNAQQTYQQAVLALAQARAARYADTVALFQALGGGWWNREDVEPEKPTKLEDFFQ
ncbi:MAG TPA: efflux transporter outer membrane subunit [Xanthobacteraceae bacterium]